MRDELLEICRGRVMHARLRPFVHRFVYRVFCLRLRIDQFSRLNHFNSWLFGIDKKRIVSFQSRDHGARDGSDLMEWLSNTMQSSQVSVEIGSVWLQCFPRVFGYVFNPVSFWFVHDRQGSLRVLLAEVNNTFGQRHQYVLTAPGFGVIEEGVTLECTKVFHVSPFCDVEGLYRFKMSGHGSQERMAIDYFDEPGLTEPLLKTAIVVQLQRYTTRGLLSSLLSMPMMTFGVMARIHWQAFKLWRQGAKYHPVPPLPKEEVTNNGKVSS
ncbi:DUF1365 domain-containing protein [Zwartia vadi]|uniref:DUF1365 domain-containing protein n=1 Tax=Zwartia vadi TaxID=3058168 RepID=UPI0025B4005B|nr:DUF1365 domain-containing protein [Zwartia vadi]MDN3988013.1 DUF1365 domain-containing protein [Zwartia vadi]